MSEIFKPFVSLIRVRTFGFLGIFSPVAVNMRSFNTALFQ